MRRTVIARPATVTTSSKASPGSAPSWLACKSAVRCVARKLYGYASKPRSSSDSKFLSRCSRCSLSDF